jgi:hypothetical protein
MGEVGNGHRRKQPNASHSIARRVSGRGVHYCDVCSNSPIPRGFFFLSLSLALDSRAACRQGYKIPRILPKFDENQWVWPGQNFQNRVKFGHSLIKFTEIQENRPI